MTTIAAQQGDPARQVSPEAVAALREVFRGELIGAGDPGYDAARRVWNGNIDRRPALVARCPGVEDVQHAVELRARPRPAGVGAGRRAQHARLRHQRRRHGHRPVADEGHPCRPRRRHRAGRRVACCGGEFDRETQAFGLATAGGTVSNTGIAGLTLGGGIGWLMGKHGLTVDNLLSADVVTADGRVSHGERRTRTQTCSGRCAAACGNFGIVTSFEYRLHPVGQILGGMVVVPVGPSQRRARFYRDLCPTLPDEAEAYLGFMTEPQDGVPVVAMLLGYNGPIEEGEKILAPARQFGPRSPTWSGRCPMPCADAARRAPRRNGLQRYWRSAFADQMSDELIDVAVDAARTSSRR